MNLWHFIIIIAIFIAKVKCAVVLGDGDEEQQGLYSKSDNVIILTDKNFDRKIYGKSYALVVQFYNSYCGHCRAFSPKFKDLALEITSWSNIIQLAVLDCSVEENNEICRQFEVMAYPSLRYLHEFYVKANGNIGEKLQVTDTHSKLKDQIISKMQNEQTMGRLVKAPSFAIGSYSSYSAALQEVPNGISYTFLVLENVNSTVGSEIAMDMKDFPHVLIKRVYDTSEIANIANIREFPAVVVVTSSLQATPLNISEHTKEKIDKAINSYLKTQSYDFPAHHLLVSEDRPNAGVNERPALVNTDQVYYSDLEKTLKTSLHTEITRFKTLTGEPLEALINYLEVLIVSFPSRGNMGEFLVDLHASLGTRNSWSGSEVYEIVKRLETTHAPVYTTNLEYVRCRGSQPKFRGYTCGLWTLFHTLTVNAAQKSGTEGAKVLRAMHGYVKHFFGCTECSQHFQAMADRNRIFDVKENNKAVLWLWIAHNEVNLRLAGDVTEDPEHPKIQFPSVAKCPECRQARGAWNLPAVYQYLQNVYGTDHIQTMLQSRKSGVAASPFSNLDLGMLSLLYMT